MKAELLQAFNTNPTLAAKPADFLDTLAEDVQAVIIRALELAPNADAVQELEHAVEDVMATQFGATLFNLFTTSEYARPVDGRLYYSARKRVVLAMIQAMLLELRTVDGTQAATLHKRLGELVQ